MLKVEHLTKTYRGGKRAVDDISLHVLPGDIYGFIGPNGAGKTTTIKSVCGLLEYDGGTVTIDGLDLSKNELECKRRMAYIPDNPDLYDSLKGIQFLRFIGDAYGVEPGTFERRIAEYGGRFELTGALGEVISAYSHGMKQKLAILAALCHEPKLLVLDEPFVGLDPKAAFTLKQIMAEICSRGGAIFFSTHVLEVAEKLCNRIAIIKNGKLVAQGETAQVKGDRSLESLFMELIDHA